VEAGVAAKVGVEEAAVRLAEALRSLLRRLIQILQVSVSQAAAVASLTAQLLRSSLQWWLWRHAQFPHLALLLGLLQIHVRLLRQQQVRPPTVLHQSPDKKMAEAMEASAAIQSQTDSSKSRSL